MKTLRSNFLPIIVIMTLIGGALFIRATVPTFRIVSGSMEPTLPVGSIVFETDAENLKPGDIITFQQANDDHPTTHTFIGYAEDGSLMTKGDANPTPDVHDVPLTQDDVLGKMALMSRLFAPSFWKTQIGVFIAFLAMGGLILLWWSTRPEREEKAAVQSDQLDDKSRELNPV
jgi:signal peptidase I, archaeal type